MAMDLQRLMSLLRQCMQRYDMVSAGDKIAVGLSGGKDSLTLLMGLKHLQRFYPVPYGLCAIHVGSGAPGSEADVETMRRFCEGLDVPFYFVDAKVYQIVFEIRKEKHPCSLCAKLRRGALNDKAMALGCNKIAYAHHQDDFIETSLMNLMLEGHYDCFPPVTHLDRTNLQVLRPHAHGQGARRDWLCTERKSACCQESMPCRWTYAPAGREGLHPAQSRRLSAGTRMPVCVAAGLFRPKCDEKCKKRVKILLKRYFW